MSTAKLLLHDQEFELPLVVGSEDECGIDITTLRAQTKAITLDSGYGNTGSCQSAITFIDGEKGILRYRGYPIEQVAEHATFPEVCYLVIYGELPNQQQLADFREQLPPVTSLKKPVGAGSIARSRTYNANATNVRDAIRTPWSRNLYKEKAADSQRQRTIKSRYSMTPRRISVDENGQSGWMPHQ